MSRGTSENKSCAAGTKESSTVAPKECRREEIREKGSDPCQAASFCLVPSLGYASNDRRQRIRTVIPDEFLFFQTTNEICRFEHEQEA